MKHILSLARLSKQTLGIAPTFIHRPPDKAKFKLKT